MIDNRKQIEEMAVLGIWVLIFFWVGAKVGDLRGDALTYAVIAKKMAAENQWLNPMLLNEPYLNKPPLFLWITAAMFKLFGPGDYAAKLPSLVFSTLDIVMLYTLSRKWFRQPGAAFFTAFSFMSTRWVVRDFASARPESLLVFGLLLGLFAVSRMMEGRRSGPYLLGVAVAVMVMTKFAMVFFLLVPTVLFAASRRKLGEWLRWPHFFGGLFLGAALPAVWMVYFEGQHPGYFSHMLSTQTIERATEGLDVHNSPLLYFKEALMYYYPWLIFFFIGLAAMWKRKEEWPVWFTLIALFSIAVPLQISAGKMSRYLIPLTPFLSMIAAQGVVHYDRPNRWMRRIVYLLGPLLLVIFWAVPVKFNPRAYHTVHLAAVLQARKPSFVDTLGFLKSDRPVRDAVPLVEWRHRGEPSDYVYTNYFYLPESRRIWVDAELEDYASAGKEKIFLLAPTGFLHALPAGDRISWTRIYSDDTSTLLLGQPRCT